jgi:hypothetical protein
LREEALDCLTDRAFSQNVELKIGLYMVRAAATGLKDEA